MDENFNINPDIVDREKSPATRDPFADEWGGAAYVDDAHKLNLNKLLHLAPYSEVLLVSGPEGVGKSTLLNQFAVGAKKSWKVVHLRASSLITTEEFLRQVVHGFGLPAAGVDDIEEMLIEIGRHLKALGRSGRRAIVVIDDFHLLADDVIVIIEHILSDERSTNAISLVLGAADGAGLSRLDNFPVLLHKLAYTLQLEPLAEADVAGYIHHRLAHSGNLAAEPLFSEALMRQLHNKSGGLPGKLNELARRHLNKKSGRKVGVAWGSGRNMVRLGLGLVGVAVVGAVLLFQDRINQLVQAPPSKSAGAVVEPAVPAAGEIAVVAEEAGPTAAAIGAAEVVTPALSMGELGDQSEGRPAEAAIAEMAPAEPEPVVAPKSGAPAKASAEPTPASAAVPAKPAAKVSEAPSAKVPAKAPEPVAATDWLQSQNPQHFTLQLMALLDESQVRQFVKGHKLQGQSEIFFITRKGNRLAALVYGSYPDRAAADEAARSLPKGWGIKEPWVRTFASVLDETKPN